MSEAEDRGGELVPFRPRDPQPTSDTSFEIELDDAPSPARPVPVDIPDGGTVLLPVIPAQWRGLPNIRRELARLRAKHWHTVQYHGVRSPGYLVKAVLWGVIGVFKVAAAQIRWWWWMEGHYLLSQAAASGDSREAMRLHKESKETRRVRGMVLGGEALTVASVLGFLAWYGRWWAWALLIAAVLPFLAHTGRPRDAPIIRPATVTPRFRRLSGDIVLRAYYAAGLGHPEKPDQQVTFGGGPMMRDGEGSRVSVDLPFGKGLDVAVKAKGAIASGLDVTESQVFLHRDPTSHRRHTLWVADRDPLAVPVGRTPLLACRQTDIWKPAPLGLDERGQLVKVQLMWNSLLCGALPRMGKTFCVRCLALYAALDPYVRLHVFDPTGKPDWRKFALVADDFAFGLTPTKDGLPPEILLQALENLKDVVNDRYRRLSELQERSPGLVPEGKLTRELARKLNMDMQVHVLVIDEFQEYLELGKISDAIAELLVFLTKVAPAAGMPVVLATQRPSGIGSGATATKFTALRDMCAVRLSLRCPDWRVSEMVLGAGALGEGLDASKLLPEYKGVAILRGATDASPTVRSYLADGEDAGRILVAARAMRERLGTLDGMALGQAAAKVETSVVADVLAVMGDRQPALHWETLATLLGQRFPERYADCNAESVSAACRAAGVPSVDVKHLGRSRMGCRREHLEAAMRP